MRQTGNEAHIVTMPTDWDFFMALTAPDPRQITLTSNSTSSYAPIKQAVLRPPVEHEKYTSLEFSTRLADWGIAPSYSTTGNCFCKARPS